MGLVVDVTNLRKTYGNQGAVEDISFTHLVELCCSLASGHPTNATLIAFVYLATWIGILFPLAIFAMRRRLIH